MGTQEGTRLIAIKPRSRIMVFIVALAMTPLFSACGPVYEPPRFVPPKPTEIEAANFAETRPVALRINIPSSAGLLLESNTKGRIVSEREGPKKRSSLSKVPLLERDSKPKVISVGFENGTFEIHNLPPGSFDIAMIGPLICNGLAFVIPPGTGPVALGSLELDFHRRDLPALMVSSSVIARSELAMVAGEINVSPESIIVEPIAIERAVICHTNYTAQDRWVRRGRFVTVGDAVLF